MYKQDEQFMKRALYLSEQAQTSVLPNPMVGALLVRDGEVLGEGFHQEYGGRHAEENALMDCRLKGHDPAGAEMYVTLEPCSFTSRTKHNGPCTEKIISAGIRRVVIARADPNPLVRGRGISALQKAGISVETGIMEEDAGSLNRIYEVLIQQKRPYVHLKAALTMDGFIAALDGSSKWISCPESRRRVMSFRRESDAVAVGRGTWEADNPSLTVRDDAGREQEGHQPEKIILSHREGPLKNQLEQMRSRGIHRLLVEGGSGIFNAFFRSGLWDRLTVFQSPDFLGRGIPFCGDLGIGNMNQKVVLQDQESRLCGRDTEINGYREAVGCLQV
ncbi:MAG: bifunctional diaminohydroxyphosphoribosylaminopyrimidine deaminase/5-amino-6-(5-phosphoribosylamino)uracil reductase RibD [Spirochaetales bacterium]|nr:bifunctional diaminohydroxyphosphoribosylaminopyrimidine deaminase/5-amino-6-(5-phosphoribosylamino)uracil reductase RibD [Spirochaetales bacterium]